MTLLTGGAQNRQIQRGRKLEQRLPGAGEFSFNGFSFCWDDETVLEMDSGDGCPTLNILNAPELCT